MSYLLDRVAELNQLHPPQKTDEDDFIPWDGWDDRWGHYIILEDGERWYIGDYDDYDD